MKELKKHQASFPAAVRELWILAVIARFPVWALELITSGSWYTSWRCCGVRSTPPQYPSSRARYSRGPLTRIFQILADIERSGHPLNIFFAHIGRSLYRIIGYIEPFSDPLQLFPMVVCGMFRAVEEIQKPSQAKNAKALMTPSSSFVKFSVAPVAQGAWLGSPAVRRERVRRAAAGDAGPTTGSSKRMGGVGVCWHRRRNASRTTRTWDSSARTHAYLRFADARRVVPGQKGCCQSSPVFPPPPPWPPPAALHAICHSCLCFS